MLAGDLHRVSPATISCNSCDDHLGIMVMVGHGIHAIRWL